MSVESAKKPYRQILQIACILLLLALLATIVVSETLRVASDIAYVKAEVVTLREELSATGYVFRQETVLKNDAEGARRYAAGEGEYVAEGQLLLTAYGLGSYAEARTLSAVLTAELDLLYKLATEEEPWQLSYFAAYEELMASLAANGAADRVADAEALLLALQRQSASKGDVLARINALEQEFDELVADVSKDAAQISAPFVGCFYRMR